MIKSCRLILATCIVCFLPWAGYAAAPVVDESENFAVYDQALEENEQPLVSNAHQPRSNGDFGYAEEQPLARETTLPNSDKNNASLLNQVKTLQQEVQELRGQLEIQTHDLKQLQEQLLAYYKDLDARLRNAPSQTSKNAGPIAAQPIPVPTPTVSASIAPSVTTHTTKVIPAANNPLHDSNPAEEQIRYLAAFDLVKTKRFDEATKAMQSFVNDYPRGGYTANAQYWLGELYMTKKDYPQAIAHFETVLQQFPSSSKSAPSLLKIGYAFAASGKKQDAIARLKQVVKNYPDTNTARLAEKKLESLSR